MKSFASILRILTFFILVMGFSHPALSEEPVHERIRKTAEDFVEQRVGSDTDAIVSTRVKAGKVDPRIQIPPCESPFQASASDNSLTQSNVTVRVSCPASGWFLYVMVNVRQMQKVVVAKQAISPGELLSENQLEVMNLDVNQLRGSTYSDIQSLAARAVSAACEPVSPLNPHCCAMSVRVTMW